MIFFAYKSTLVVRGTKYTELNFNLKYQIYNKMVYHLFQHVRLILKILLLKLLRGETDVKCVT